MRLRLSVTCAATVIVLLTSAATRAADGQGPLPFRNLQTSDSGILSAISACYSRSITCRRLIDEIESSSTIVYIRPGQCQFGIRSSCLIFSAAQAGVRYLQIVLDKDLTDDFLVAAAAHELQHAVEVVRAPEVGDLKSFRLLYVRIGFCIRESGMREDWETDEAQRIALAVSKEVRRSQRADLLTR
jgi:hypothetical protein